MYALIKNLNNTYSKFFIILSTSIVSLWDKAQAIKLSIPPSDGFKDIAEQWPQHINGKSNLIYDYIQVTNEYLWFSIIIISFGAIVWLWVKLMINPIGSDEWKTALKNTILGAAFGIIIAMISYALVRITINFI